MDTIPETISTINTNTRNLDPLLHLNISGIRFDVLKSAVIKNAKTTVCNESKAEEITFLEQFVQMSHENRLKVVDYYTSREDCYFFARSAQTFEMVLDFYTYGELHCHLDICPEKVLQEMTFWNIPLNRFIAPCCAKPFNLTFLQKKSFTTEGPDDPILVLPLAPEGLEKHVFESGELETQPLSNGQIPQSENSEIADEMKMFEGERLEQVRRKIWAFLEYPSSSFVAKIFSFVSVSIIVFSVLALIVASLEVCQKPDGTPHIVLEHLEFICIGWFTMEYCIRLLVTAQRLKYIKAPLNVIDALSILPFYAELLLQVAGISAVKIANVKGALLVTRLMRVLRVARVFRLARYSGVMKNCGKTMRASGKEVGMLVIFVSIMIVIFSSTVFFLEKDVIDSKFTSIPAAFWWCIVTITTVGYGDMSPVTVGGRVVASLASVSGVVVLAFPITVIVENFYRFYKNDKKAELGEMDDVGPHRVRGVAIV